MERWKIITKCYIFKVIDVLNFTFKKQFLFFWTKFAQKKVFSVENGKSEHYHWILHIHINADTKFQLKLTIWFFGPNLPKKWYFRSKIEKVTHLCWILHIQINIDTKFQLKLTILIFWTKFTPKGYSWSKTEKVNITIEFRIFE